MDAAPPPPAPVRWSLARLFAFRLGFVYLLNFALQTGLGSVPGLNYVAEGHGWVTDHAARLFARHVLGIDRDLGTGNGSGDRTLNYVTQLYLVVLSVLVALAWSAIDRRRSYRYLPEVLRVALRYALGATMLSYGLAKVFPPTQFPEPDYGRLTQPYGESSPMGLLWTFMGASQAYTFFGGVAEVAGGVLLLFRRTALLGALVTAAVMTNVVMLNFCYDVPVKLYSVHYLVIAILIAWPDVPRLFDLFVRNRPVPPRDIRFPLRPSLSPKWERRIRVTHLVLKLLLVVAVVGLQVWGQIQMRGMIGAPAGPFEGSYLVERFEVNGSERLATPGDPKRWRTMNVIGSRMLLARLMDGSRLRFLMATAEDGNGYTLTRMTENGTDPAVTWAFTRLDADTLELSGKLDGEAVRVRVRKADRTQFLLVNRGFHWVNETPYNR